MSFDIDIGHCSRAGPRERNEDFCAAVPPPAHEEALGFVAAIADGVSRGGEGGMAHFMAHIGPAIQDWMDDLGNPRLTPEVQKTIIDGVAAQANGRTIAELREWRDRKLIEILKVSAAP